MNNVVEELTNMITVILAVHNIFVSLQTLILLKGLQKRFDNILAFLSIFYIKFRTQALKVDD